MEDVKTKLKSKIEELTNEYINNHVCRHNCAQHDCKEEILFLKSILELLNDGKVSDIHIPNFNESK